jgi:CO/xanthine dehydrogenase Mo-binding subunit
MASKMITVPIERLEAKIRLIYDRYNRGNYVHFRDVVAKCMKEGKRLIGQGWWTPPSATLDPETGQGDPYFVYSYSTHMAEVIVDVQTGEVEIADYVAATMLGGLSTPRLSKDRLKVVLHGIRLRSDGGKCYQRWIYPESEPSRLFDPHHA